MKPFLLLQARPEAEASEDEYEGFLAGTGLRASDLHRVRLDQEPLGELHLDRFSGVIVGGSPFNVSSESKGALQRRVEADLGRVVDAVVAGDLAFLGACYGMGILAGHLGGVVDESFGEPVAPVTVTLTPEGRSDSLCAGLPPAFPAFVGHKEACSVLPTGAVLLASSDSCPVQAIRIGQNVYATQFHPELTRDSIITRIRVYQHAGYFSPDTMEEVIGGVGTAEVIAPVGLLHAFVERYQRD